MIVESARQYFIRDADDEFGAPVVKEPERTVGQSARLLYLCKRTKDGKRHPLLPDTEILQAALRLRPPVAVYRYLYFAHTVAFDSMIHTLLLRSAKAERYV